MSINSLSLYTVCAIIVILLVAMMVLTFVIVRHFWQEKNDNRERAKIRQDQAIQMRYKYAVYPGYVYSQNDHDKHWVSADKLIRLYGVKRRDCLVIREHERGANGEGLIPLKPRSNGDYRLPGDECYGGVCDYMSGLCSRHLDEVYEDTQNERNPR